MDKESGLVHTVKVTAANEHDVTVTSELLTGDEEEVYEDSGYLGKEKRPEALKKNKAGKSVHYKINRRPSQSKNNSARSQAQIKRREHEKSLPTSFLSGSFAKKSPATATFHLHESVQYLPLHLIEEAPQQQISMALLRNKDMECNDN